MTPSPARGDPEDGWHPVCPLVDLDVGRGVTALVHGQAVAIFRTRGDTVYVLGNHDPFARGAASTLARGVVGHRRGVPFVAVPAHRHAFDLRTGACLEDRHVQVPAYDVRVVAGVVQVGGRVSATRADRREGGGRPAGRAPAPGARPPAPGS